MDDILRKFRDYTYEIVGKMGLPDELAEAVIETTEVVNLTEAKSNFLDEQKKQKENLRYIKWKIGHHETQQMQEEIAKEIIADLKKQDKVSEYEVISKLEEYAPSAFITQRILSEMAYDAKLSSSPEEPVIFRDIKNGLKEKYDNNTVSKKDLEIVERRMQITQKRHHRKIGNLQSEKGVLKRRTSREEYERKFDSSSTYSRVQRKYAEPDSGTVYITPGEDPYEKRAIVAEVGHAILDIGAETEKSGEMKIDYGVDEAYDIAARCAADVPLSEENLKTRARIGKIFLDGENIDSYEEVKAKFGHDAPKDLGLYLADAQECLGGKDNKEPGHEVGSYIVKTLGDKYGYDKIPRIFGKARDDPDVNLSDPKKFISTVCKKYASWNL